MFDIFNRKKIKKLEEDISFLYKLCDSNEEKIKENKVFEFFRTNDYNIEWTLHGYQQHIETATFEDISVKTVVGLILKKLGLKVRYTPGKKETVKGIPPSFKLEKRGTIDDKE